MLKLKFFSFLTLIFFGIHKPKSCERIIDGAIGLASEVTDFVMEQGQGKPWGEGEYEYWFEEYEGVKYKCRIPESAEVGEKIKLRCYQNHFRSMSSSTEKNFHFKKTLVVHGQFRSISKSRMTFIAAKKPSKKIVEDEKTLIDIRGLLVYKLKSESSNKVTRTYILKNNPGITLTMLKNREGKWVVDRIHNVHSEIKTK